MLVKDVLAEKPVHEIYAIAPGDTVSEAAKLLSEKRVGALIVREGEEMKGILSERDIVREIGARGVACMSDCVRDIMTDKVRSCSPSDTMKELMVIMTEGRFRHMPVMDNGKLVGVISIGDVVATRIKEIQIENQQMAELIAGNI